MREEHRPELNYNLGHTVPLDVRAGGPKGIRTPVADALPEDAIDGDVLDFDSAEASDISIDSVSVDHFKKPSNSASYGVSITVLSRIKCQSQATSGSSISDPRSVKV